MDPNESVPDPPFLPSRVDTHNARYRILKVLRRIFPLKSMAACMRDVDEIESHIILRAANPEGYNAQVNEALVNLSLLYERNVDAEVLADTANPRTDTITPEVYRAAGSSCKLRLRIVFYFYPSQSPGELTNPERATWQGIKDSYNTIVARQRMGLIPNPIRYQVYLRHLIADMSTLQRELSPRYEEVKRNLLRCETDVQVQGLLDGHFALHERAIHQGVASPAVLAHLYNRISIAVTAQQAPLV